VSKPLLDPCSVVSPEEIASIFGRRISGEPKKLEAGEGGFRVAQCRVALQDDAGMLDIRIVQKGAGAEARDPRDAWKESFAPEKLEQAKGEAHRPKWIPEEVRGIGEGAFWRGDNKEGSLYALKGNAYVRITLSSRDDKNEKLRKCSAVASAVLKHL
jgi:hypothetical protein